MNQFTTLREQLKYNMVQLIYQISARITNILHLNTFIRKFSPITFYNKLIVVYFQSLHFKISVFLFLFLFYISTTTKSTPIESGINNSNPKTCQ